jgi:hypothetical protein
MRVADDVCVGLRVRDAREGGRRTKKAEEWGGRRVRFIGDLETSTERRLTGDNVGKVFR